MFYDINYEVEATDELIEEIEKMFFDHGIDINSLDPKKTIVVDVDDTILTTENRDYPNSVPNKPLIEKINKLFNTDWTVIYFSARGHVSFNNDAYHVEGEVYPIMEQWMVDNNVQYDHLILGKPIAAYYIDDKAIRPDEFLELNLDEDKEYPFCHMTNVNDDWVYVCQYCGAESCPDCGGRCGCE